MEGKKSNQVHGAPELDMLKQLGTFMQERRLANYTQLNRLAHRNGVVFAGDSITEHFPVHELLVSEIPIYNRGISGYTTRGMLRNLRHLVLDLEPSQVFLLIGTNDLGEGDQHQEIVTRIADLCSAIRDGAPAASLTVLSVYPVNPHAEQNMPFPVVGSRTNEEIIEMNEAISKFADQLHIQYLSLYDLLADENGWLQAAYTYDGLHLNVSGYEAVSAEIQKLLL
ncbi:SGNH/GDSL hydrolase family protein [Paenibacillus luteus]|uniref:SGNH/GDSL hydrolase family protein n=1 Tax=Paenibacillus luteus TaxID=2545753 RepID=UPI0011445E35|nr:SGNH/GDSL hydrolase family protein [Paenibacillus luteus]